VSKETYFYVSLPIYLSTSTFILTRKLMNMSRSTNMRRRREEEEEEGGGGGGGGGRRRRTLVVLSVNTSVY
jgi:hypothetical protein